MKPKPRSTTKNTGRCNWYIWVFFWIENIIMDDSNDRSDATDALATLNWRPPTAKVSPICKIGSCVCLCVCVSVCLSACVCVCVCGGWFSLFPTPSEGFQSPGWRGGGGGRGGVSEAAGTWTLRPMKTMGVLYRGHPSAVQLLAHSWWEECSHQSSNKRHRYRKVAGGTWLFPTSITL